MKKWLGGTLILSLALLLAVSYTLFTATSNHIQSNTPTSATSAAAGVPSTPRPPKPRLLPSLEGLADLFPTKDPIFNGTQWSSNPKLAWARLGLLLSRSDGLPGTADGVREAGIAWRELAAALSADAPPKEETLNDSGRNCPFSVAGNGSSIEIPCGFVENSAVSIVGVPIGTNGSSNFAIELVGPRPPGMEASPPIALRINVSLGGEVQAIAMNSWTSEHGWGNWEQCPAHGSHSYRSNLEVDGLVRCNEQSGKSVIQEVINGSQIVVAKPPAASKISTHSSVGFPFVEGQPFTATLWVGLEGFHLTVNGRHEASFAYRVSLEPWSVSSVSVEGELDLLSLIANDLPVSEDVNLVADLETLKAPPVSKRRLLLLIGVFSSGNNFERRMALRKSWMQYKAVRSGEIAVRFFSGLHKNERVNLELWQEAQVYGDIQLMPFVDYYGLITLKTIAICIFGAKILPAKYIMKMDDDAFVRIDETLSILQKSVPNGLLYGSITFESSPHRDMDSKWFVSPKEWPHDSYPPWAHGPGYIISRDIAKFIVHGHQERDLQLFKLEDVAMGMWVQEYKKSGHEVNYVNDDHFHNDGCESGYVLAHYQGPRLLLCLWDKLQKAHQPICCE